MDEPLAFRQLSLRIAGVTLPNIRVIQTCLKFSPCIAVFVVLGKSDTTFLFSIFSLCLLLGIEPRAFHTELYL